MLQGLAQFRVALTEFPEQTHVLDGDYGLVGEGLDQFDLFVRERFDSRHAKSSMASDRRSFSQQRHC